MGMVMAQEKLCRISRARAVEKAATEPLTLATIIAKTAIRAKGLRHLRLERCSSLHCQGLENLYSWGQHKSIAFVTVALSGLVPKPAGELWRSQGPPATVPGCLLLSKVTFTARDSTGRISSHIPTISTQESKIKQINELANWFMTEGAYWSQITSRKYK